MSRGVVPTDTVLDRILERTVADLTVRKAVTPEAELEVAAAESRRRPLDLAARLAGDSVAVIAEVKRGSPSRGVFPVEIDPRRIAGDYKAGGASAISCLTDSPFFHGSREDLEAVADVAHGGQDAIPVLRKDFTVDRYQLLEAVVWGADAVLLIVAALDDALLQSLHEQAVELGLSVLIEVHDEPEVERALALGPSLLGVNNRNLKTFDVDLGVTARLSRLVPDGTRLVSESGIFTADDVRRVADAGASAVLVGESLILQEDRVGAVHELATIQARPRSLGRR